MRHIEKNITFFIVPLFVVRLYSLLINHEAAGGSYLAIMYSRGFLSDAMVGLAVYLLLNSLPYRRVLCFLFLGVLTAAAALNVEHISANGSNADFSFIGLAISREFIGGSVLTLRNLQHVLICAGVSAIVLCAIGEGIKIKSRLWPFGAVLIIAAVTLAMPVSARSPGWIQMNLIEQNMSELIMSRRADKLKLPSGSELPVRFYKADLSGVPVIEYPTKKMNVLLILVEGISHNAGTSKLMPNLRDISANNISYSNFIGLQHQTNRGLYAVLCGDYPNMLSKEAKSDFIGSFGSQKTCLPEALGRRGYDTVFMQSARLGYMRKDLFTKNVGFGSSFGGTYKDSSMGGLWGVDDMTLYMDALMKIRELSRQGKPWFMTLLTVSTHHPYIVPEKSAATKEEALMFADRAVGEFIRTLELSGALKDTLVIITTDEASLVENASSMFNLARNHALLAAVAPDPKGPIVLDGTFSQLDIAMSILDYLGLDTKDFVGRSIFRRYDGGRDVIFGNVYSSRIFGLSSNNELYVCTDIENCDAYRIMGESLFDEEFAPAEKDPAYSAEFTKALILNDWDSEKFKISYVYREINKEYCGNNLLLGDHRISVKEGDKIRWRLWIETDVNIQVGCYAKACDASGTEKFSVFDGTRDVAAGDHLDFKHNLTMPMDIPWMLTSCEVVAPEGGRYLVKELSIKKERRAGSEIR